jgi:hypothetical protein
VESDYTILSLAILEQIHCLCSLLYVLARITFLAIYSLWFCGKNLQLFRHVFNNGCNVLGQVVEQQLFALACNGPIEQHLPGIMLTVRTLCTMRESQNRVGFHACF